MKVDCENCGSKLNLPDDRIEEGSAFSFNCPKCKHKNTVSIPARPKPDLESDDGAAADDFFEEGAKPALICFDSEDLRNRLSNAVKKLGYAPVTADSARDALKRIKLTQYRMVLVDEEFDGQTRDANAVLSYLQYMDMTTRRRIFVALFGNDFTTLDYMISYALSVNAVVNKADVDQYEQILRRAVAENVRFYKVFFDVSREIGKI